MKPTLHEIALYLTIAGGAAGLLRNATNHQRSTDALNARIAGDEEQIRLIEAQLPKDQRAIFDALREEQEEARQRAREAAFNEVMRTHESPVMMQRMELPADAIPAVNPMRVGAAEPKKGPQ